MNWNRWLICFLLFFPPPSASLDMCPVIEPLQSRRGVDSGMVTAYEIPGVSQPERDSRGRLYVPGAGFGPWRYRAQCLPLCIVRGSVPGVDGRPPVPVERTFYSSHCPPTSLTASASVAASQSEAQSITSSSPEPSPATSHHQRANATLANQTHSTQMYAKLSSISPILFSAFPVPIS